MARDYKTIVSNVQKMLEKGAPDTDINGYLRYEGMTIPQFQSLLEGPTVLGQAKEFVKGIPAGAAGLLESAGVGLAAALPDEYERPTREKIQEIGAKARKSFEAAPGYEETTAREFGEAVGSTAPFFALGPVGTVGRVGAAALATGAGAGESRLRAEKEGATDEQRRLATGLGSVVGSTELLPVFGFLSRLSTPLKQGIISNVQRALVTGGMEGAQEAAAALAQNLIAQGIYKPEQELIEGVAREGAYGAGVGALIQGITDMALGRRAMKTITESGKPGLTTEDTIPVTEETKKLYTSYEDATLEIERLKQSDQDSETKARIKELEGIKKSLVVDSVNRLRADPATDIAEARGAGAGIAQAAGLKEADLPGVDTQGEFRETLDLPKDFAIGEKTARDAGIAAIDTFKSNLADITETRKLIESDTTLDKDTRKSLLDQVGKAERALKRDIKSESAKLGVMEPESVEKFDTVLSPDLLARTGLKPQSGFFKELANKDMANPADAAVIADVLKRVRSNSTLAGSTKEGVEGVAMQAFNALATQQSLFDETKTKKAKPTKEVVAKQEVAPVEEQVIPAQEQAVLQQELDMELGQQADIQAPTPPVQAQARPTPVAPTQREVIQDVRQPTQDVAGVAEPSIYVPGQRRDTTAGIAEPTAGGVVPDSVPTGQPVGGEGAVSGALEPTAEQDIAEQKRLLRKRTDAERVLRRAQTSEETRKAKEKLQKIDAEWEAFSKEANPRADKRVAEILARSQESQKEYEKFTAELDAKKTEPKPVSGALDVAEGLNPRQVKEYNDAKAQYLTNMANESVSGINRKYGVPKGDPLQLALDSLANDLYAKENTKLANRFFRGLPNPQRVYVEDKIASFKQQERRGETEIARLDAMREQQSALREEYGDEGDIVYRTKAEDATGMSIREVQSVVNKIVDGWKNSPIIQVVQSVNQLPQDIQAQIARDKVKRPQGVWDDNTQAVYLIADNLSNSSDVGMTIAHEATGHFGLRTILGENYSKVMNQMYGNAEVKKLADAKMAEGLSKEIAVEEVLADMAETGASPSIIQQLVNILRNALRAIGINLKGVTNGEVAQLIKDARQYVIEGKGEAGPGTVGATEGVFRSKDTLTEEGKEAQEFAKRMAGISNEKSKKPTMSMFDKLRTFAIDPTYRQESIQDKVDNFRTKVAYHGASAERKLQDAYNGAIRDSLGEIRPDLFMTAAEHADTLAVAAMKRGQLRLDKGYGWVADDGKASMANVFDIIHGLGRRLGSSDLAFKIANDAFIARRASTLKDKGIIDASLLPDQDKIDAGLEAFKKYTELNKAFDQFTEFKNGLIDAMVEGGRLSKEDAASWKAAADYVPWNRIKEYEESVQSSPKGFFRGLTNLGQMKHLKGGKEDEINNVFDNMVGLSFWMTNSAVRNHAGLKLADAFVKNNLGARKVRPDAPGVNPNNLVYLYRDGTPEAYEFDSPLDVYAFKGIESIGGPILDMVTKASNLLRKTTTAMPQFALSQLFQDSYRSIVLSGVENPYAIPGKVLSNFISEVRGGDSTTRQLESMGIVGAYDLMPGRAKEAIEKEFGIKQRSLFEKGLAALESFSIASDAALRKSVFEQTLKETVSDTYPEGDVLLARYRAQEIINFKRQGSNRVVGVLRQVVPFMNAYIQGMDVLYRTMNGRGITAQQKNIARNMFLKRGAVLATLSTIYAMLVAGDDEYEGLADYDKNKHFIFPGTGIKLPVAPEIGFMFKTIPERLYTYMASQATERPEDAKMLLKGLGVAALDSFSAPNITPQLFKPGLEIMTNYSFFKNAPIVSLGMARQEPWMQYTDSTSELARTLGRFMNWSPVKIDHFLRGHTGIAGGTILDVSSMMFGDGADKRVYELPGVKTFMYDKIPNGFKQDFYAYRDEVSRVVDTVNAMKSKGMVDELVDYLQDPDKLGLYMFKGAMSKMEQRMEDIRKFKKLVSNDRNLDGANKKDILERFELMENQLIEMFNVPKVRSMARNFGE